MELPRIGLGTWELKDEECMRVVRSALDLGYQHIDTAHVYRNHTAIREAIKHVDRKDFYITSKIMLEEQVDPSQPDRSVQQACDQALSELGGVSSLFKSAGIVGLFPSTSH